MKQSDLKYGNVIETNDGKRFLYIYVEDKSKFVLLNQVSDFMSSYLNTKEPVDVVKVYADYKCDKVIWKKKKMRKLTNAEKTILESIDSDYKFICRDGRDNTLYAYKDKPEKDMEKGRWYISYMSSSVFDMYSLSAFNHMFDFITWEDSTAWTVEELLKGGK